MAGQLPERTLSRGCPAASKHQPLSPGICAALRFERHILTFCDEYGDKSDQEFEEAYSNLRRRPDGRSLGPLHDFAWQVSAVMLGTRVVSRAEFEGVIGALATSASKWATGQVSRNYMAYLRNNMAAL